MAGQILSIPPEWFSFAAAARGAGRALPWQPRPGKQPRHWLPGSSWPRPVGSVQQATDRLGTMPTPACPPSLQLVAPTHRAPRRSRVSPPSPTNPFRAGEARIAALQRRRPTSARPQSQTSESQLRADRGRPCMRRRQWHDADSRYLTAAPRHNFFCCFILILFPLPSSPPLGIGSFRHLAFDRITRLHWH